MVMHRTTTAHKSEALVLVALLLSCGLVGCQSGTVAKTAAAATTGTPSAARMKAHPLYPALLEYDREIAALQSTLATPEFARRTQDIAAAQSALAPSLNKNAQQIRAFVDQKAAQYQAREDNDVAALLAAASAPAPSQNDVRQHVAQTYRQQYAQLRAGAGRAMSDFQAKLSAQQTEAYNAFVRSIQDRTQRAYEHRATELRESELNLQLELARRDAPLRLPIRMKLNALWLRDTERSRLRSRLAAIQAREDRAVAALQRRDAGTLSAYRAKLQAQASADIAHMSVDLQSRAMANLAARRDVLAAQEATSTALPVNGTVSPPLPNGADLRQRVAALRATDRNRFRSEADADIAAFTQARNDLTSRFAGVGAADSAATRGTLAEIAALERDRSAVYSRIVSDLNR